MVNVVFVSVQVLDAEHLNFGMSLPAHPLPVQLGHGTHKSEDPVSKLTEKVWKGVPIVMFAV